MIRYPIENIYKAYGHFSKRNDYSVPVIGICK